MHRSWENCRTAAADVGSLCPVLLQPTLCTEQLWVKQYVFLEDTQRSRHITGNKVSAIIELCSYAIHTPCARAVQLNCVVLRVDRQCKCAAPPTWEYHREYAAELFRAKRMYDCRSAEQRECTIVDLQSSGECAGRRNAGRASPSHPFSALCCCCCWAQSLLDHFYLSETWMILQQRILSIRSLILSFSL